MGFPPCRSRKRPSPPEGRGPDVGPLRALHLKHTFLPACHRKVSTDMLAIGFSPCLSKKRPSQGPNGQALRNLAEKNRPRWPHFRLGLLAGSPSRKPNKTARRSIKDKHKRSSPYVLFRVSDGPQRLFYLYKRHKSARSALLKAREARFATTEPGGAGRSLLIN